MSLLMARFERVKNEHGQSAYRIHCGTCRNYVDITRPSHTDIPPDMIAKKARQKSWEVDKRGRAWCPTCMEVETKPKKEVILKPVPSKEVVDNIVPVPPRAPSPTDLRRIMREIDDNWDEPKAMYAGTASDQSIADKLNVPRAWVADERKRAFGDSQRNEAFDNTLKEARALEREIRITIDIVLGKAGMLDAQLTQLQATIKKLEKLQ